MKTSEARGRYAAEEGDFLDFLLVLLFFAASLVMLYLAIRGLWGRIL